MLHDSLQLVMSLASSSSPLPTGALSSGSFNRRLLKTATMAAVRERAAGGGRMEGGGVGEAEVETSAGAEAEAEAEAAAGEAAAVAAAGEAAAVAAAGEAATAAAAAMVAREETGVDRGEEAPGRGPTPLCVPTDSAGPSSPIACQLSEEVVGVPLQFGEEVVGAEGSSKQPGQREAIGAGSGAGVETGGGRGDGGRTDSGVEGDGGAGSGVAGGRGGDGGTLSLLQRRSNRR
jgi:hypothetical protein